MNDSSSKSSIEEELSLAADVSARYWEAKARRYEEVHDRSPDGMMIFRAVRDETGPIVDFEWLYCNPSASRIVGRKAPELLGKRLLVEMPGNKETGLFDAYVRVVERGEPYSHEFAHDHEGLHRWLRAYAIKLGDGFSVAFSDLTVRKRGEVQTARLEAIVHSSEHAIYSMSNTGIVETWNSGAEKLFGYTSLEMVGRNILVTIPEERRLEHEEALRRALDRGGVESFQSVRATKAGLLVHVAIMLSPIRDADSRTVATAVVARDVSEEVKLQGRLVFADRMASVGTLAAGAAHEINNPLASVIANLDVAIEELRVSGDTPLSERLKELERLVLEARGGADRIGTIVRGLMTFSRADEERSAVVDVKSVLASSASMALHEIRQSARIVEEYGAIPLVFADEARLGQVFIDLLVNAAQAIGRGNAAGHEIRITTSTDSAGRAVVEVRDTGSGIPPEILGRVFDPFFTTKPMHRGAGLGLSICHNIVTGMGGEVGACNNDGPGATFRVVLPPAPAAPSSPPEAPRDSALTVRRGHVLVVDDDRTVGAVLGRILRDHDVMVVTTAKEALAILAAGRHFDVILSDLMMPEMSGIEFYDELGRQDAAVAERVVFITGGVFTPGAAEFLDRVVNERMSKPFDTKSVRSLVRRFVGE
jgi:PAS domain S-box-containing protein